MNLTAVKNFATSKVARQVLLGKKHSPVILLAGGTVGFVTTTVLASKATLRFQEVVEPFNAKEEKAKKILERPNSDYTVKDYNRDLAVLKTQRLLAITKLYGPAATVGVASLACFTGSHVIMHKRNVAIAAAYAALDKGFAEYRERVAAQLGEDNERELRHGVESKEVHDTKNGTVEKVKTLAPKGVSIYAKLFGPDYTTSWHPRPELNFLFLKSNQNYMNNLLQTRGHVLLNDVYDALGLDRTKEGAVVGWVKGHGDGFISFGIFDDDEEQMLRLHDLLTNREKCILLDFNVDGVIYDLI